jgi:hypothetical protein
MRSSSAFILIYTLCLLGFAAAVDVSPYISRQVIVFVLLLSTPFLVGYGLASCIEALD